MLRALYYNPLMIVSAFHLIPPFWVLMHLSKGQWSKDHIVQGTLVQEDFCPRRHWSKETIVQGESLKH